MTPAAGRRRVALGLAGWGLVGCAVPPVATPTPPSAVPPAAGPASMTTPPPIVQPVPFSASPPGGPPQGWSVHARPGRKPTDYTIVSLDGRSVLQARSDAAAGELRCPVDADPQATPWLQWQWRAESIIAGATVADPKRDDAPLRLAVVFGATRLVYVWDGMAPVDKVIAHPGPARVQSIVVESGGDRTGRWLAYRRHLVDDHRRVFGEAPGRILAVEVLTDGDDLATQALGWYGDVTLAAG